MPRSAEFGCCDSCGWRPEDGDLWPTEGPRAVWWIQRYCICGEGDWYGKPIVLRPDQKLSLYRWYEFCGGCGRWRYSHWVRTEATGGGKTTFMAAVMALELAGPPQISPVSPVITSAANSWEQANKLFGAASIMCGGQEGHKVAESPLKDYFEVYDSKIRRKDGRPGEINRVAAVAGTNEGGLPSLFVVDEVHELGDVGETRVRMHVVIGKSTNKRQLRCEIPLREGEFYGGPGEIITKTDAKGRTERHAEIRRGPGRIIDISTAGFDIDHSFFGGLYKHGKESLKNPAAAPRLLFECWEAPLGLKFTDPADRLKAVMAASPAAGILWDPMDRVNEWDDPKMPHTDWGRYYGNRWEKIPEDSWLKDHPGKWEACQGSWAILGDEPTVLAVDMALKRDSVSVGEFAKLADGRVACTWKIWYPAGGKIDHLEVWEHIQARATELGERYFGLVYDPRFFELPARALEEEGFLVIEFNQSPQQMAPACGLAQDMIVAEMIVHDGDEDASRQVLAAAKRQQERGFTLSKGKSRIRIDSAITLCMGVDALARLTEEVDPLQTMW